MLINEKQLHLIHNEHTREVKTHVGKLLMNCNPNDTCRKQYQYSLNHAIVEVAAQLLTLTADTQDTIIHSLLQRLGTLLRVDRGYVFNFSNDLSRMSNTHEWCAKGIEPQRERIQNVPTDALPWWKEKMMQNKPLSISCVNDMPPEALLERKEFSFQEIQSLICLPLIDETHHLTGFMGFDVVRKARCWSEQEIDMLSLTAHLLATAIGRSRAQHELMERKALLEATGSLARVGGWQLDITSMTLTWTKETFRIHDVPQDEMLPLDKAIEFIHPDDRDALSRAIQRAITLGEPYDMEIRLITATGKQLWIRTLCQPEVMDGKTVRLRGILQDITERKQTEDALRDSNKRLEAFLEVSHAITACLDTESLMQMIVDNATKVMRIDSGAIYLLTNEGNIHLQATTPPLPSNFPKKFRDANVTDHPHVAQAISTGNHCIMLDSSTAHLTPAEQEVVRLRKLRSSLFMPIRLNDESIGVLILSSTKSLHTFNQEDITFLQGFADHAAQIINTVRNYETINTHAAELEEHITALQQAEQIIRENAALLARTEQIAHLGSWNLDLSTNRLYWSDEVYRIFGCTPQEFEPSYEIFFSFVHPDDQAAVEEAYRCSVRERRASHEIEHRIIRKDTGEERIVHEHCIHEFDDEGAVIRSIGMVHDITERKRVEEALRLHSLVLDQIEDWVTVTNLSGKITYVNQAVLDLLGFKREEILNHSTEVYGEDAHYGVTQREILEKTRRDGHWRGELVNYTKNGRQRFLDCRTQVVRDEKGQPIALCGIATDISERKRVERYHVMTAEILELLNQPTTCEDTLRSVVDTIRSSTGCDAVGIRLSHEDDFPYFVQNGFSHAFLLTENTLIARDPDGATSCGPDGKITLECTCGLVVSGKTDLSNPLFSPGGSAWTNDSIAILNMPSETDPRFHPRNQCIHEGYASIALIPIRSRQQIVGLLHLCHREKNQFSGEVIQLLEGIAAHIGDALNRIQMEEEEKKLQTQLFQVQKMESVGRLAGGVAHDFNNMLMVISGEAEMAMLEAGDNDQLRNSLLEIQNATTRSANLTRQLLAFARRQSVEPRALNLNETIEGMLKMLRRLIGEDINLVWQPGCNLHHVFIDPVQVDQILVNLCVNARDAIAETGKIIVETHNVTLDEAYCAQNSEAISGEFVMLAVSDNGRGMDAEIIDHVFEPFFSTKVAGKGTGLGLATVYGVVVQNSGFINVYSEPDQGTTFKIYLPQHVEMSTLRSKQTLSSPPEVGNETILLVEDESAILKVTATMLKGMGYTVITASTPGEAIRLAREYEGHINLLMTDVIMPEMNGRDLAKKLMSIFPHIKRLFMSGYTANIIAHQGVLDKGVHFIEKPFSQNDLAAKIREALD